VSAQLRPATGYTIKYDIELTTWDSYSNVGPGECSGSGYYDSFSVSVTPERYWEMKFEDRLQNNPVDGTQFDLLWGGLCYGDSRVEQRQDRLVTGTLPGNVDLPVFLNVVLDTGTEPEADSLFPSWGLITLREVISLDPPDTKRGVGP